MRTGGCVGVLRDYSKQSGDAHAGEGKQANLTVADTRASSSSQSRSNSASHKEASRSARASRPFGFPRAVQRGGYKTSHEHSSPSLCGTAYSQRRVTPDTTLGLGYLGQLGQHTNNQVEIAR